jgi:hypothetical protein
MPEPKVSASLNDVPPAPPGLRLGYAFVKHSHECGRNASAPSVT